MNTQATQSEYMLFFRDSQWDKGLSPEEIQQVIGKFMGWFQQLKDEGKAKAGQPLERSGKIVSGPKGKTISDGPFAESKEAIGGYFLLQVSGMDEALEIAKNCPILDYGAAVEVRPVAASCPIGQRVSEELAQASA